PLSLHDALPSLEYVLDAFRTGHELVVTSTHGTDLFFDQIEQLLFCFTPAKSLFKRLAKLRTLLGCRKGTVQSVQVGPFCILGFTGLARVGHDAHHCGARCPGATVE